MKMEERYKKVRKQLDELGYTQVLILEALPLVDKLTADLIQTTESLQKYKKVAKETIEERDRLLLGAEPYKCANAKLVEECNDLHLAFLQFREQNEKAQKDLKLRLSTLEQEKAACDLECERLRKRICDLEVDSANKTDCILSLHGKTSQPGKKSKSSLLTAPKSKTSITFKSTDVDTPMDEVDKRVFNLTKQIRNLKEEQIQLSEINETYKIQLFNRNREIERLSKILEGETPIQYIVNLEEKIQVMEKEICSLKNDKLELENYCKEAVCKQHQAMKRAVCLADRNKQLEEELRDVDNMALAVEADSNIASKMNAQKMNRLQEQVNNSVSQIKTLERDISNLKRQKQELITNLDTMKYEKDCLQTTLETEKKMLNDRINSLTVIEQDLNLEIDRLVQLSANQKRRIAELECKLVTEKYESESTSKIQAENKLSDESNIPKVSSPQRKSKVKSKQPALKNIQVPKSKSPRKSKQDGFSRIKKKSKYSEAPVPVNSPESLNESLNRNNFYDNNMNVRNCMGLGCCKCCPCRMNNYPQDYDDIDMQALSGYHKTRRDTEYEKVLEQTKNISSKSNDYTELLQKLNEKERDIAALQNDNTILAQEKHNLMTRLETARDRMERDDDLSIKSTLRKCERERDILKADIASLEEERNILRNKLKACDCHMEEIGRLNKLLVEMKNETFKLQQECRELMKTKGSKNATITTLDDQCNLYKEQLRISQTELNNQTGLCTQLKTLQEQTDKALADSQNRVTQLESELARCQERFKALQNEKSALNEEVVSLKSDVKLMKGSLSHIDQEKDGLLMSLDDKTERIAALEQELKSKDSKITIVESIIEDLNRRLSMALESSTTREQLLRSSNLEVASLRQEIESTIRSKESVILENRRIQGDLASVASDSRSARNEVEIYKRQIDDLKTQLQQYVAEVKRFEDLMQHKEVERSELLDQFKSLSHEASLLETSNHSLVNQACESKVQLSVTLDHVAELETKLAAQNNRIGDYEQQISELYIKVSNLEKQLDQCKKQQERTESDLASMQNLCVKLDRQKDDLMDKIRKRDEMMESNDRDRLSMRRESETLQATLAKDRSSLENVEHLLSEARQGNVQLKLYSQELESEIRTLKGKIEELQSKICPAKAIFTYSTNLNAVSDDSSHCACCISSPGRKANNISTNKENKGEALKMSTVVLNSGPKYENVDGEGQMQTNSFEVKVGAADTNCALCPIHETDFTRTTKRIFSNYDKQPVSIQNCFSHLVGTNATLGCCPNVALNNPNQSNQHESNCRYINVPHSPYYNAKNN